MSEIPASRPALIGMLCAEAWPEDDRIRCLLALNHAGKHRHDMHGGHITWPPENAPEVPT